MRSQMSADQHDQVKKADRIRKWVKRRQMTSDQQDQVRLSDRERWHKKRKNMTQIEKEKVRAKDRDRKKRRNRGIVKEVKKIEEVLRIRKFRSLLSEEEKIKLRDKAKVEMASNRKNGSLMKYKQTRTRRDRNRILILRDFLDKINYESETPKLKCLNKKLKSWNDEVKAMEYQKRQKARMYERMGTFSMGRAYKRKQEEPVTQKSINMRKHRKKIKEVIKDYEKLRKTSGQVSYFESSSSDTESDSDNVNEGGDIDVYS